MGRRRVPPELLCDGIRRNVVGRSRAVARDATACMKRLLRTARFAEDERLRIAGSPRA
jgi:hypothetical protein